MITEEEKTLTFESQAEEARVFIRNQTQNFLAISGECDEEEHTLDMVYVSKNSRTDVIQYLNSQRDRKMRQQRSKTE